MNKKLMTTMLIPLALMLVVAFGYAQFTSQITETVTATAGSFDIEFTGTPTITFSSGYMTGSATITSPTTLTVTASNFAPGDYATVTFYIISTGTLPGVLSETNNGPSPFTYSDNVAGTTIGITSTAGPFTATITLPSGAGNVDQGAPVTFTVTITGTAT